MLADVKENRTWAQAWYFPRVPDSDRKALFRFYQYDGLTLDVASIYTAWLAKQQKPTEPPPTKPWAQKPLKSGEINPIEAFNKEHTPGEILERNGYIRKKNRWLCPHSTTGIPGVLQAKNCKDGRFRVYSTHGSDPLNDGFTHDAFDLYCMLECGGDFNKAMDWSPEITEHNRELFRQEKTQQKKPKNNALTQNSGFTLPELMNRQFPPICWAIPDILPEGVALFAGPPKIGKSWLALNLALAKATGGLALGKYQCAPGGVLYLALEDNFRRLQRRFTQALPAFAETPPKGLHLYTEWSRIGAGGEQQVIEFLEKNKDVNLIIIDTLAKIRPPKKSNADGYAQDYAIGEALKPIIDKYRITILVLHHTRKMTDDSGDAFMDISGTLGLTGGVDGLLVMKRAPGGAVLHITGRDVEEEAALSLSFDRKSAVWSIDNTLNLSLERLRVVELLQKYPDGLRTKAIGDHLETPGSIRKLLGAMLKDGQVIQENRRGVYKLPYK